MVIDMRSRMSLSADGWSRLSSKEGKATMIIGYMDIARLMIHVKQFEEDKLRDREGNESGKKKIGLLSSKSKKDLLHRLHVHIQP